MYDEELWKCRPYGGAFQVRKVVGSRFIIISGNLSFRTVQDFLSEFYHPAHDKGWLEWCLCVPFCSVSTLNDDNAALFYVY
jgi:hypothetical protein